MDGGQVDVANQLAHRANAAALASGPFPVTVHELEAVRRELAGVREALDGGREVSAQGEREAIEARVRAEVLSEVGGDRQRRWQETRELLGAGPARSGKREVPVEGSSDRYRELLARIEAIGQPRDDDEDDDGEGVW